MTARRDGSSLGFVHPEVGPNYRSVVILFFFPLVSFADRCRLSHSHGRHRIDGSFTTLSPCPSRPSIPHRRKCNLPAAPTCGSIPPNTVWSRPTPHVSHVQTDSSMLFSQGEGVPGFVGDPNRTVDLGVEKDIDTYRSVVSIHGPVGCSYTCFGLWAHHASTAPLRCTVTPCVVVLDYVDEGRGR